MPQLSPTRPAPVAVGALPAAAGDPRDSDTLLAEIRQTFEVRAALIGLAATASGPREAGHGSVPPQEAVDPRICASLPLALPGGPRLGLLILIDEPGRVLTSAERRRLERAAGRLAEVVAAERGDAAPLAIDNDRLRRENAALQQMRSTFERAAASARLGIWECRLRDERLDWTGGVHDMFDIPAGTPLIRGRILELYSPDSLVQLHRLRSRAISEGTGFALDAAIVTPRGRHRWIRLTADVDRENGRAVRLFGTKQDITEEKLVADRTRWLAEFDVLTGLANRAQFESRLEQMIAARRSPFPGSSALGGLILVDLDGFKHVNDTHGHAIGDACLKEAAARLRAACPRDALVARLGGDEFAILVGTDLDRADMEALGRRIVEAMRRPMEGGYDILRVGASVGIASAGGATPDELFMRADAALYAAKAGGRGTWRVFSPAMAGGLARRRA